MDIETFENEEYGVTGTLSYDEFAGSDNPREWDNCWTILTNQGPRYHDIDETLDPDYCTVECDECDGEGLTHGPENKIGLMYVSPPSCPKCEGTGEVHDIDAYLRENYNAYLIVPVYKYEHGLVKYEASSGGNPFHCEWDSGMVGVAVISKETVEKEWGGDYEIDGEFKTQEELALRYLDGELETYTSWCNGEIYVFDVEIDGEHYESCGGFYERDYAEQELKDYMEFAVEKVKKEREDKRYWETRDVETIG